MSKFTVEEIKEDAKKTRTMLNGYLAKNCFIKQFSVADRLKDMEACLFLCREIEKLRKKVKP